MNRLLLIAITLLASIVLAIAALGTTAAPPQDAVINSIMEQLKALQTQVMKLENRVAAIEAGDVPSLGQPRPITAPGSAMLPANVMQLTGVETVKADTTELLARIEEIEAEAEALQRTADSFHERIVGLAGSDSGSGYSGARRDTSAAQQRAAYARLMAEYNMRARQKTGEANRLRRELTEPLQIVTGVFAGKTYKLYTEADLACGISKVAPGQYLTWKGRRESLTDKEETWRVTEIEPFDLAPEAKE